MTSPDQEPDLLRAFEMLLACSTQMLEAARDADWDALIEHESEYLAQVEGLQQLEDAQTRLDDRALERKARILEQLLEQDKEIRQRLLERREELSRLILGSRQQKALSKTYSYYQGASDYQEASEIVQAARRFVPS